MKVSTVSEHTEVLLKHFQLECEEHPVSCPITFKEFWFPGFIWLLDVTNNDGGLDQCPFYSADMRMKASQGIITLTSSWARGIWASQQTISVFYYQSCQQSLCVWLWSGQLLAWCQLAQGPHSSVDNHQHVKKVKWDQLKLKNVVSVIWVNQQ